jgi:2TM domain
MSPLSNNQALDPQSREATIRKRVHKRAEFYRHAMTYVLVITGVWILNAVIVISSGKWDRSWAWWAIWPTLGWGIGLAVHAVATFSAFGFLSDEWEEKKVRELMDREQR